MEGVHVIFDVRLVKAFKDQRNGAELVVEAQSSAARRVFHHIVLVNYWHSPECSLDELLIGWRILD